MAEKNYNSGFEWVKIAKANSITNPDTIEIGTKLTLPDIVETKILATSTNIQAEKAALTKQAKAISSDTYTIQRGDNLWDIAVRAYGDGFKWPEIAKANNLENPSLIHADNVLKLPRD
ncbi:MAG: LysM peptidoglycan-binding domain-containing protein [Candidatus Levyibacteriota bacterium]|nr:MAG: LysM peptidoglycan-binding domain-containing protein [Candidatus Levybacteria bacterium]